MRTRIKIAGDLGEVPRSPDADVGNQHPVPSLIFTKKKQQQQPAGFFFDRTRARPFISPTEWPGLHGWQSLEEDYRPPPRATGHERAL